MNNKINIFQEISEEIMPQMKEKNKETKNKKQNIRNIKTVAEDTFCSLGQFFTNGRFI